VHTPVEVRDVLVAEVEHPEHGSFRTPANPANFSGAAEPDHAPPPALGEHTVEVRSELGYPAEKIGRLEEQGVVLASTGSPADPDSWSIAVLHPDGRVVPLVQRSRFARYSSTGHLLYTRDGSLLAAPMDAALRTAVLNGADAQTMGEAAARQDGYQSMPDAAEALIDQGITDTAEARRVLGSHAIGSEKSP
jgi:hypothetical protein